jgi:hypothetical protein
METMMHQLLSILTTSTSDMQRMMQLQTMLQELRSGQSIQVSGTAAIESQLCV